MPKIIPIPKQDFSDEHKLFDHEKVLNNLTIAGLYLVAFEMLESCLVENLKRFFYVPNAAGDRYEEELKKFYPKDKKIRNRELFACIDWHISMQIINENDKETIKLIIDERNNIAHELPKYLVCENVNHKIDLLSNTRELIAKIDQWWIFNVDIPCTDRDHNFSNVVKENEISSSRMMLLDYILRIVFQE
jgi:hypothetical protein